MTDGNVFSRPFAMASIDGRRRPCPIAADAGERLALARILNLLALEEFTADLEIHRINARLVEISGRWRAGLTQACVISLFPVPARIEEGFRLQFLEGPERAQDASGKGELELGLEETDPPELVTDGTIDLGMMLVEQLILALDPYPRAADASLPTEYLDQDHQPVLPDAGKSESINETNPFKMFIKNNINER